MKAIQTLPILDRAYLERIGFVAHEGDEFMNRTAGFDVRVDHKTGKGVLVLKSKNYPSIATPVQFMTVSHLKWFMDAFK